MNDEARRFGSYGEQAMPAVRVALRDWLILGGLLRSGAPYAGKRLADIGCGYYAESSRGPRSRTSSALLVDVSIAAELKRDPTIDAVEGLLPDVMEDIDDRSIDVLVCSAALE